MACRRVGDWVQEENLAEKLGLQHHRNVIRVSLGQQIHLLLKNILEGKHVAIIGHPDDIVHIFYAI